MKKKILKTINTGSQLIVGFTLLGAKYTYKGLKRASKYALDTTGALLPFLSQNELLRWSKELTNSVDGMYDKAMDAVYNKTHIGGSNHRLFDGGHGPIGAWEAARNASETDTFAQEVIGYVMGLWKDMTTVKGMPFKTMDKTSFDKSAEWVSSTVPGADKKWFYDLLNYDAFEILTSALGAVGAIFFLKKGDKEKLSEILGSMGIISIITANPLMGIMVIFLTAYSFVIKKEKLDEKILIKGAGLSAVSCIIFATLGLPILVELVIVMVVFRLLKGQGIPGKDLVKRIIDLWKEKTPKNSPTLLTE